MIGVLVVSVEANSNYMRRSCRDLWVSAKHTTKQFIIVLGLLTVTFLDLFNTE